MEYQPIEKLLPRSGGSVYRLVRMAASRALELSEGKPRLIEKTASDKFTSIALQEILEGKIEYSGVAKKDVKKGEKEQKNNSSNKMAEESLI